MAQIGTLISGAGVVTTFSGLSQLDEFMVIGDADTASPLQGLSVEVNGVSLVNINSSSLIGGYAKWLMESTGASVGLMLKFATGRIKGNTIIRLTNSGATTPAVYAFSDNDNGFPFQVATEVILAGSYSDYSNFSALIMTSPTNIQQAVMTFSDGYQTIMSAAEIGAYFALTNQSESDGYLNGCAVIDNSAGNIAAVRVFATGANLSILRVSIPNQ